jgi:hypothetical protein
MGVLPDHHYDHHDPNSESALSLSDSEHSEMLLLEHTETHQTNIIVQPAPLTLPVASYEPLLLSPVYGELPTQPFGELRGDAGSFAGSLSPTALNWLN